MAKRSTRSAFGTQKDVERIESKALILAERGPVGLMQIAELSLSTACDAIRGAMEVNVASVVAKNIGVSLKAYELQLKYGPKATDHELLRLPSGSAQI